MAPRSSTGSAKSSGSTSPKSSTPNSPAAKPASTNTQSTAVVAKDSGPYDPTKTPILFMDDEVKRMHKELEQREREEQLIPRSQRNKRLVKQRKSGVSFTGFCTRVGLFYLIIAYFLVCPTDSSRDRAVCRGLDSVHSRLAAYEPHLRPYVHTAQKKLDPYLVELHSRAEPYITKARPYYTHADRLVRPQVARASSTYRQHVHPALLKGVAKSQAATKPYVASVKKQYERSLAPSVEWYSVAGREWYQAKAEPHLRVADKAMRAHSKRVYDAVSPVYTTGLPFAQKHYRHTLLPFAKSTYSTSRRTYVKQVHPRLVVAGGHAKVFYKTKVLPALQRFYSLFIAPQLDKISERIFEYRTKKSRAEAAEHVKVVEKEVLKEVDADNFEDFISELRDTPDEVDTSQLPPSADVPPPAEPSLTAEELKALNVEKRTALQLLQDTYEKEITKLGQTEHDLLLERLVTIRSNAVDDIPKRFDVLLTALDEEGDKMVGRLGKYFARAQGEERFTPEEKVKDAEFLSKKAVAKVRKMAEDVKVEAEEYKKTLEDKEEKALKKASEALEALVGKAQEELGYGWTWLDDVTVKDWQRYHGLGKAEKNWKESYRGLQSGTIKDSALTSLKPVEQLDAIQVQAQSIVDTFAAILAKILAKGQKEIMGEWTGVVDEAQKAYAAAAEKAAAAAAAVKESASSLAGVKPTPTDAFGSASSLASVAQVSAAALAAQAASAIPAIPVVDNLASVYGEASQTVLRAVGSEPSPTDFRQSASSAARAASLAAETAYAEASQSILRALGAEPKPTDLQQSITSLAKALESSAAVALEGASSALLVEAPAAVTSALGAATSAVDAVVDSGVSLGIDLAASVSSLAAQGASLLPATPILEQLGEVTDKAQTFFGEASQTAIRAVGGEPSPTDVAQSATSVAAAMRSAGASLLSDLSGAAAGVAGSATVVAAPAAATAAVRSAAESLASQVSAKVHDATRTTPEGVRESATSLVEAVKSKVAQVHLEL